MRKTIRAIQSIDGDPGTPASINIELPSKCPHCETALKESPITSFCIGSEKSGKELYSIFYCPHCENGFFASYYVVSDFGQHQGFFENIYPNLNSVTKFSSEIKLISEDFVKIYNQSEQAESTGLTEICGIGYRKALEFLVKDYAISICPDDSDKIKSMSLAQCINKYISAENIKTLAERSAWIGNDEAHYTRKHEDRNFADMKKFIQAMIYFIGMSLITDDAMSIEKK